ncbi:hypothetical protein [Vibrio crassostreae]|uniref:hypothetical protein n=1 Tax=Vibrio crassostreae TaxID=246167 RepID=UPI001B300253|nr:hypothetical protein [Vibrio crassostreae]
MAYKKNTRPKKILPDFNAIKRNAIRREFKIVAGGVSVLVFIMFIAFWAVDAYLQSHFKNSDDVVPLPELSKHELIALCDKKLKLQFAIKKDLSVFFECNSHSGKSHSDSFFLPKPDVLAKFPIDGVSKAQAENYLDMVSSYRVIVPDGSWTIGFEWVQGQFGDDTPIVHFSNVVDKARITREAFVTITDAHLQLVHDSLVGKIVIPQKVDSVELPKGALRSWSEIPEDNLVATPHKSSRLSPTQLKHK